MNIQTAAHIAGIKAARPMGRYSTSFSEQGVAVEATWNLIDDSYEVVTLSINGIELASDAQRDHWLELLDAHPHLASDCAATIAGFGGDDYE